MAALKGPGAPQTHDGSGLRIGIVHARWNWGIIEPLLEGAKRSMLASGVKEENIVVQSVPGSYELPFGVQRVHAASQIQSSTSSVGNPISATDLLSSSTTDLTKSTSSLPPQQQNAVTASSSLSSSTAPFDAIIAIGVLIKGETMHFEYIADAVSHGLMRVQLDTGVPVVFGLLTVLNEEQGLARAGLGKGEMHNHGEDWGSAAVELGVKRRGWAEGKMA